MLYWLPCFVVRLSKLRLLQIAKGRMDGSCRIVIKNGSGCVGRQSAYEEMASKCVRIRNSLTNLEATPTKTKYENIGWPLFVV